MKINAPFLEKFFDIVLLLLGRKKRAGEAFTDYVKMVDAINRLIWEKTDLNIERILIVRATNEGGKMNPFCYKFITVMYEDCREPFEPIKDEIQKLPTDQECTLMLAQIYEKKGIELFPEQLKPGLVWEIFKSKGVQYAEAHFIAHNRTEFYYVSIGTGQKDEQFKSPEHRFEIYKLVGLMRRAMKNY